MASSRYQLIEALPFPRAEQAGWLRDPEGVPLHGAYERSLGAGYRAAIVNNGRVVHRYDYPSTLMSTEADCGRSFRNLVHTLDPWLVPADAERPVTDYPASEFPRSSSWRPLWHEPYILEGVRRGAKPVGLLVGGGDDREGWLEIARSQGLPARHVREWVDGLGRSRTLTLISRPGLLATSSDLQRLEAEYAEQLPTYPMAPALARLALLTADNVSFHALVNPASADDLIVSGFCFGYPVATTAACITGSHG